MGIVRRRIAAGVARGFLRSLEVSAANVKDRHKVMAEVMNADGGGVFSGFFDSFLDRFPHAARFHTLDLHAGALVMPRKEGQGGERFSARSIQACSGTQIIFECHERAIRESHYGLFVALADDYSPPFVPIQIPAPQGTRLRNSQPSVRQGQHEGSVPQLSQSISHSFTM